MTMLDMDPDVVRWGLHLIDVCSFTNDGSKETITCYEKDMSRTESVREGFCNSTSTHYNVENDEEIALALQQELSRLSTAESSISSSAGEHYQNESSGYGQGGLGYSREHSNFIGAGFQGSQEEAANTTEIDISGTQEYNDRNFMPEIEDKSDFDGEVGKRLNQMTSVPHIPKINGEIPTVDEATSDHQRLLNRLQLYDLVELKISGDGNCQFRSLSDQIYRSSEHHKFVREQVVEQLKLRHELYENYVPMAYGEYLRKMSKNGEWGDHITLQAAADWYGIKIFVITSFKDTCYIEILPQTQKSNRMIFLSFWAEVHYNSIYPIGEFPQEETKKKKRWWQ